VVPETDAAEYITVTLSNDGDEFTLRIENTSEAAMTPTPFAPGVAVVHGAGTPLFAEGVADPGYGLEALAEDGDPAGLVEWLTEASGVTTPFAPGVAVVLDDGTTLFVAGAADEGTGLEALAEDGNPGAYAENTGGAVFAVPTGAAEPGPLFPGESYTVEVEAAPGHNLTLATMFVQSNDWFFSLGGEGIALFDTDGSPLTGDVTDRVTLWDAGTEVDQTPGVGADQAPRQAVPDTGDDDTDTAIRQVAGYPASDYILVTITPRA
jgi:hypothetical protein